MLIEGGRDSGLAWSTVRCRVRVWRCKGGGRLFGRAFFGVYPFGILMVMTSQESSLFLRFDFLRFVAGGSVC